MVQGDNHLVSMDNSNSSAVINCHQTPQTRNDLDDTPGMSIVDSIDFASTSTSTLSTNHTIITPHCNVNSLSQTCVTQTISKPVSLQSSESVTPKSAVLSSPLLNQSGTADYSDTTTDDDSFRSPELRGGRSMRIMKRGRRQCTETLTCPVCHVRVPSDKARDHLADETSRLNKWMNSYLKKSEKRKSTEPAAGVRRVYYGNNEGETSAQRYRNYERVKRNRQRRGPVARTTTSRDVECPVCGKTLEGSPSHMNEHVNLCLAKQCDETTEVDVMGSDYSETEESFEEYEWAGQKRVRITSMANGNLANMGFQVARKEESGSDVELDIEDDESSVFGQSQYSEIDLIPCKADEPKDDESIRALRRALVQPSGRIHDYVEQTIHHLQNGSQDNKTTNKPANTNHPTTQSATQSPTATHSPTAVSSPPHGETLPGDDNNKQSINKYVIKRLHECDKPLNGNHCGKVNTQPGCSSSSSSSSSSNDSKSVESLKQTIKELRRKVDVNVDKYRCLICMESYTKPLTSVQCWHVHCEECWLRTLGVKKLCPQCNLITHPSELRKIYL